jgi:hypothetical protein
VHTTPILIALQAATITNPDEAEELEDEIAHLEEKIAEVREELESARGQHREELREGLEEAAQVLRELRQYLEEVHRERPEDEREIDDEEALIEEIAHLKEEIAERREELEATEHELRELENELKELRRERERDENRYAGNDWEGGFPPAKHSPLTFEGRLNLDGLRRGIEYLQKRFGPRYPGARDYLLRIDEMTLRYETLKESARRMSRSAQEQLQEDADRLRRDALWLANPLINFDRIVFIKRNTYNSSHFYTDFIDGCERPGGHLCILSLKTGKVTRLLPQMAKGIFGRFDLSFDAKKIVFDWKRSIPEGFRLYEVNIDGTALRQLTFPPEDEKARIKKYDNSFRGGTARVYNHHTDDMHPCFLPDGGICFTSSRCEYGTLCDGPDILASTILYRIDGDGKNMRRLTNSSVSEFSPALMEDGRILYTRWEYVDKGQLYVKCLWAMRPDGSGSVEIFGNDIPFPPSLLHGRQIPGKPSRFVTLGTPHYPQSGIGTILHLDTTRNIRSVSPMTYVTPAVDIRQEPGWNFWTGKEWVRDGSGRSGRLYMDPYPLDENTFLVACKLDPRAEWSDKTAYGLYLLDTFGNHTLIYKASDFSCWQPIPLLSRKRPPVLAMARDPKLAEKNQAVCIVQNISYGIEGVEPGTIKWLRIMEQVPRPWGCRRFWDPTDEFCSHTSLVGGGVLGLKVMHGIVPVYEDGSAHFLVPADKNIYFQALDENYLEIQRERTYINYQPGEIRSCAGCHEKPKDAPRPSGAKPIALLHPPSKPQPQPGDRTAARVLHYPTDVQPVLDKHCIKCHSGREPKGGIDLTDTMTELFTRSFGNLSRNSLSPRITEVSERPRSTPYVPALTIGSGASPLIKMLREGHNDVKLSREELLKISTWIDAGCQFYGTYYGRKNIEFKNHPNFRPTPTLSQAIAPLPPIAEKDR